MNPLVRSQDLCGASREIGWVTVRSGELVAMRVTVCELDDEPGAFASDWEQLVAHVTLRTRAKRGGFSGYA